MTTITTVKYALVSAAGGEVVKTAGGTTLATLATGDVVAVLTVADSSPQMNSQQQTVTYRNTLNRNWARNVKAGSSVVSLVRSGITGVQWASSVLAKISVMLQKTLTWTPPIVVAQPAVVSVAHSGGASATFIASFGSEIVTAAPVWAEGVTAAGVTTWTTITPGSGAFTTGYTVTTDTTGLISTLVVSGLTTTGKTGYQYRCTATDTAAAPGSVTTAAATLAVT